MKNKPTPKKFGKNLKWHKILTADFPELCKCRIRRLPAVAVSRTPTWNSRGDNIEMPTVLLRCASGPLPAFLSHNHVPTGEERCCGGTATARKGRQFTRPSSSRIIHVLVAALPQGRSAHTVPALIL